jgi:hypothetical protein
MRLASILAPVALSLVVATQSLAAPVSPGSATAVQREQAQSHFARGRDLFAAKKYDQALAELKASIDIVASPNARLIAARCYREMGRLVDAYAEFGRAAIEAKELAREDPRYQKAAEAAIEERDALAPQLGFVMVTVGRAEPSTTLTVGGDEVHRSGWSEAVPVRPGTTEIVVATPSRKPLRQSVTVSAGERKSVSIDAGGAELDAPPAGATPQPAATGAALAGAESASTADAGAPRSDRRKLRPWAYVAGGVGVVGFLTFAIAGSMSSSTYNDLKRDCNGGPCPPDRQDDISAGRTQQTVANVGLVFGVLGVAAGTTLFILSLPPRGSTATANAATDTAPRLVARPQWIGLEGRFE